MTREEAIAKIREAMPTLWKEVKDAIQILIPELSESEDERIRKLVVNRVRTATEMTESLRELLLSYLEKQKELPTNEEMLRTLRVEYEKGVADTIAKYEQKKQKPAEWKPQPESLEALMYAIEGEWDKIKPTSYLSRRLEDLYEGLVNTFNVDESLLAELPKTAYSAKDIEELRVLKDKIEASMESPVDKPAEWSDTDNIGWDEAFACVTRAEKSAKNEEELQNAVTAEKWLKEIKFKYCVHPVKQEWSEEDENMYKMVSSIIHGTFVVETQETKDKLLSWLKSLRP